MISVKLLIIWLGNYVFCRHWGNLTAPVTLSEGKQHSFIYYYILSCYLLINFRNACPAKVVCWPFQPRQLLLSMLDAVYFDTKKSKSIVAIRPKPPFKPVFQVAASKEGSGIHIVNEPYLGSSVFVVEAGESRTRPETTIERLLYWLTTEQTSVYLY